MKLSLFVPGGLLLVLAASGLTAQSQWPKEIPLKDGGQVTIYQPQPDRLEGNKLFGRSAVSVRETEKSELVFGALFFEAFLATEKSTRIATLDSIHILSEKFSGVEDTGQVYRLSRFLEREIPKWELIIPLDALVATLDREFPDAEIYNNDPPKIYFRTRPSSLVLVDGDPKVKYDESLKADRVLNTPNLIFKDNYQWKLYLGGIWYTSTSITTGWRPDKNLSEKIRSIDEQIKKEERENNGGKELAGTPKVTDIIVSTGPAELIQTRGEPDSKPIEGTSLSFVENTENHILMDNTDKRYYILIAGRWFASPSLEGPWTFNEPDKLPQDFSRIPPGHEKDGVLASVAGTDAANEAMIDAIIPQTAKVDRKTATVTVRYDGSPKFAPIPGTNLRRAENSPLTVFQEEGGKYFALDNGVWFTAMAAEGPWQVATERPAQVDKIPMTDPTYNAKFVFIYEVTPDYTIQGYTGGYLNCFIQGDPVVIYGTGYYYRPWYGTYYYTYPWTWGFGYVYTPYYGWAVPYTYNQGYVHFSFSFGYAGGWGYGYGGWCGPSMYHPPYYYRPPHGGWYGPRNSQIDRPSNQRPSAVTRPSPYDRQNIYRDKSGLSTLGARPVQAPATRPAPPSNPTPAVAGQTRPAPGAGGYARPVAPPDDKAWNNVYTDKAGNVYQRDKQGTINQWDNKKDTWNSTGMMTTRPSPAAPRPSQPVARPSPSTPPASRPSPAGSQPYQPSVRPAPTSPYSPNAPNRAPSGSIQREMEMRDRSAARTNTFGQVQRSISRPGGGAFRSF